MDIFGGGGGVGAVLGDCVVTFGGGGGEGASLGDVLAVGGVGGPLMVGELEVLVSRLEDELVLSKLLLELVCVRVFGRYLVLALTAFSMAFTFSSQSSLSTFTSTTTSSCTSKKGRRSSDLREMGSLDSKMALRTCLVSGCEKECNELWQLLETFQLE